MSTQGLRKFWLTDDILPVKQRVILIKKLGSGTISYNCYRKTYNEALNRDKREKKTIL